MPYLDLATHILTPLNIAPLQLPPTSTNADSILEDANTTALDLQNTTVADAFERSLAFQQRGPTNGQTASPSSQHRRLEDRQHEPRNTRQIRTDPETP